MKNGLAKIYLQDLRRNSEVAPRHNDLLQRDIHFLQNPQHINPAVILLAFELLERVASFWGRV